MQVGGDALIRGGRRARGTGLVLAGPAVLPAYGFTVNLTRLDFGRLMGLYIAVFVVVPRAVAVPAFKERRPVPVLVGGTLVVAGGPVLTLRRPGRMPSNGLRPAPIARPWNKWHKMEHYSTLNVI